MKLKSKIITGIVALITIGIGYFGYSNIRNENQRWGGLYQESQKQIVGTVLEEIYQNTISPIPKWNGVVSYSNPTINLDSEYTLKIKTDNGRILAVSVIDAGRTKKEALDALVNKGSRVSFTKGNIRKDSCWSLGLRTFPGETYFHGNTQMGTKGADAFKVLD